MLIKIVHQLRLANGSNAKLAILKKHKNNDMWKKFLLYTYDTRMTFGVSAPAASDFDEVKITGNLFLELNKLARREVTGNEAKNLARFLSERFGEIARLVLGRSIKAGISSTTINKAYPGLITIFESMKGKDCIITEWPVASSTKYDGVKVFAFVSIDDIFFTSSSGAEFKLDSLKAELTGVSPGVYEGELIYKEGKVIHRPKITGYLNSLLSGTKTDIEDDYSFCIYDYIFTEAWAAKHCINSFQERQQALIGSLSKIGSKVKHVIYVNHKLLKNMKEVVEFYENLSSKGYEGSMHRYVYDSYRWNRSERLVKKKAIRECVLKCEAVTPHSNPSKGNIGSLFCRGTVTDKDAGTVQVSVNVGSGLSKYDIQYTEDRYIGESIEIIYNSVTKTDKGYSLFLPRYKRLLGGI